MDNLIPQHKRLAMGESIGSDNFGCQSMESTSRGGGYSGKGGVLKDKTRGASRPIRHTRGRHPSQAAPDHGEH